VTVDFLDKTVKRSVIASTAVLVVLLLVNAIALQAGPAQNVKQNAKTGSLVTIALSIVCARKIILWRVITKPVNAFVRQKVERVRQLNIRACNVNLSVLLVIMVVSVIISAIARTTHLAIRILANAFVIVVGMERFAIKNVRTDTLVLAVRKNVPKICHLKPLAIT
jgi:F0F1-type ATP synthase membrane subunit a